MPVPHALNQWRSSNFGCEGPAVAHLVHDAGTRIGCSPRTTMHTHGRCRERALRQPGCVSGSAALRCRPPGCQVHARARNHRPSHSRPSPHSDTRMPSLLQW
eukprot:gene9969-biopygen3260